MAMGAQTFTALAANISFNNSNCGLTGSDLAGLTESGTTHQNVIVARFTDPDNYDGAYTATVSLTYTPTGGTQAVDNPAVVNFSGAGTQGAVVPDIQASVNEEGVISRIDVSLTDTGENTITCTATTQGNGTSPITVADAALTAFGNTAGQGAAEQASQSYLVGWFTDADNSGTVSDYTAAFNFGDSTSCGTQSSNVVTADCGSETIAVDGSSGSNHCSNSTTPCFSLTVSHTYAEEGTDGITWWVTDHSASANSSTGSNITITDAALSFNSVANPDVASPNFPTEGTATGAFDAASVSDPGADSATDTADYSAGICWGDSTTPDTSSVSVNRSAGAVIIHTTGHTYKEAEIVNPGPALTVGNPVSATTCTVGQYDVLIRDVGGSVADGHPGGFTVSDAALAIGKSNAISGANIPVEGAAVEATRPLFWFTDSDATEGTGGDGFNASDYTASITGVNCPSPVITFSAGGDSATSTPNHFDVACGQAFTYTEEGNNTLNVTVTDGTGSEAVAPFFPQPWSYSGSTTQVVQDASLIGLTGAVGGVTYTGGAAPTQSVSEGSSLNSQPIGAFTDQDSAGTTGDYQVELGGYSANLAGTTGSAGAPNCAAPCAWITGTNPFTVTVPSGVITGNEEGLGHLTVTVRDVSASCSSPCVPSRASWTQNVLVNEVATTVTVLPINVTEGGQIPGGTSIACITDPGIGTDTAADFNNVANGGNGNNPTGTTYDWGDGAGAQAAHVIAATANCTGPFPGSNFEVVATNGSAYSDLEEGTPGFASVTVRHGGENSQPVQVDGPSVLNLIVADANLHPGNTTTFNVPTGGTYTGVLGYFFDDDPNGQQTATGNDYTVTAATLDGNPTSFGTITITAAPSINCGGSAPCFQINGKKTFTSNGTHKIVVTVQDHNKTTNTTSFVNVGPLEMFPGNCTSSPCTPSNLVSTEGATGTGFTGVVANFIDASPQTVCNGGPNPDEGNAPGNYSISIDWGDHTVTAGTFTGSYPNFAASGSHLYREEGVWPINVTITDNCDGSTGSTLATLAVSDAPLTAMGYTLNSNNLSDMTAPGNCDGSSVNVCENQVLTTKQILATFADADLAQTSPPGEDTGDYSIVTATNGGTTAAFTGVAKNEAGNGSQGLCDIDGGCPDTTFGLQSAAEQAIRTFQANQCAGYSENGGADHYCWIITGNAIYAEEGTFFPTVVITELGNDTEGATLPGGVGLSTVTANDTVTVIDPQQTDLNLVNGLHCGGWGPATNGCTAGSGQYAFGGALTEGATNTNLLVAQFADPGVGSTSDFTTAIWGTKTAYIDWGDGVTQDIGKVSSPSAGNYNVKGTHTYAEEGTYNGTVTISDIGGAAPVTIPFTVVVNDAAITLSPLTSGTTPVEGTAFGPGNTPATGLLACLTDADPNAVSPDFSATWNTGAGSGGAGLAAVIGSPISSTIFDPCALGPGVTWFPVEANGYQYPEEGTFHYNVSATDIGLAAAGPTPNRNAVVSDAPLSGIPATITGNVPNGGTVARFTDQDVFGACPAFPATCDYTVSSINWGDGTPNYPADGSSVNISGPDGNGVFTVTSSGHNFAVNNATINVTIADAGGQHVTVPSTTDLQLTLSGAGSTLHGVEGAGQTYTLGSLTDADTGETGGNLSVSINWGDGQTTAGTLINNGGGNFTVQGTHAYGEQGSYTVNPITVTDSGGAVSNAVSDTISVADAALSQLGSQPGLAAQTEGTALNGGVLNFADADPNAVVGDFAATVNGIAGTVTAIAGGFQVGAVNVPLNEEPSTTLTIHVGDADGTSVLNVTRTITTNDAGLVGGTAPTIAPITEGGAFSGPVATFTDTNPLGGVSDFTATINWGDGSATGTGNVSLSNGVFTISGSHTYAENGAYTITAVGNDAGGSTTGNLLNAITVNDAALLGSAKTFQAYPGTAFTGAVASFTDGDGNPDAASVYAACIDWGDGSNTCQTFTPNGSVVGVAPGTFNIVGTHTYANSGQFTVTSYVTDGDGPGLVANNAIVSTAIVNSQTDRFIQAAYHDLLGRAPDTQGEMNAIAFLTGGGSRSAFAQGLDSSNEYYSNLVTGMYTSYLGRTPDAAGLSNAVSALAGGLSIEYLRSLILGSGEYWTHSGGTATAFCTSLYTKLLNRAPDSAGLANCVNNVNASVSRQVIAWGFLTSNEYQSDLVQSWYQTLLMRTGSAGEVAGWVGAFGAGWADQQIIAGFVGSTEYFNDAQNRSF